MKKILLYSIALFSMACMSQKKKPVVAAPGAASPGQAKVSIQDKIKSCREHAGLFRLYQDTANGTVYMLVKKEQLDKDYIYFSYTVDGIVAAGHFRGAFRDNKVFTIRR